MLLLKKKAITEIHFDHTNQVESHWLKELLIFQKQCERQLELNIETVSLPSLINIVGKKYLLAKKIEIFYKNKMNSFTILVLIAIAYSN